MIELAKLYEKTNKYKEPSDRRPKLVPSSLPFCPRKFILQYKEYLDQTTEFTYANDFFMGIGTHVHGALQRWLTKDKVNHGVFFGNWECLRCKTVIKYKAGPIDCPNCKRQMSYEEIRIEVVDTPMNCYIDAIMLDTDFIKDYYDIKNTEVDKINDLLIQNLKKKIPTWVGEYKTGSLKIRYSEEAKPDHKSQAKFYVPALRRYLNKLNIKSLDVKGYVIKYFGRDNPWLTSKDFKHKVIDDTHYEKACKLSNKIYKSLLTNTNLKKLFKRNNSCYKDCNYDSLCEDLNIKDFTKIIKEIGPYIVRKDSNLRNYRFSLFRNYGKKEKKTKK